eukprot:CAMPEP_0172926466 /NCGR_PEP_ID=MMETSP1075-20121228/215620_1 /TAXON_ID=2916 /ORGANISM="Ceratium fusus, Strain PA161109" /LENGTH=54 /DNA_ID=CAMNT_0013787533 /DNA_START=1 /DNA_END=162 /DNA_ORIENTATION=-
MSKSGKTSKLIGNADGRSLAVLEVNTAGHPETAEWTAHDNVHLVINVGSASLPV